MRFLLAANGTYGDVAPFVAVGTALQKRGHEALMAANPFFIPMAREKGLPFRAVETWREADAILMTSSIHRKHGRATLGATTDHVMLHAPCEVVVVRLAPPRSVSEGPEGS